MHTDAKITPRLNVFSRTTHHPSQKIVDVTHFIFLHSQSEGFSSPLLKNAYTCLFNLCYCLYVRIRKHTLFWPLPAKVKNDLKKCLSQISKVSFISVETANGRIMFHVLAKLV